MIFKAHSLENRGLAQQRQLESDKDNYFKLVVFMVSTLLVMIVAAITLGQEMLHARFVLEFHNTRQPPELDLAPGKRWHLFFSHRWDDGQDM